MVRNRTRRNVLKSAAGIGALTVGGIGVGSAQTGVFVGETGFVRIDQSSPNETTSVPFEGVYTDTLPVNHEAQSVSFTTDFDTKPVVLSQSQTERGNDAVVTRAGVARTGFNISLQEQEVWKSDGRGAHITEQVGYIAAEVGTDGVDTGLEVSNEYEAAYVRDVDHNWKEVTFSKSYDRNPLIMAEIQTRLGRDPAGIRRRYPSNNSIQLMIEKEHSEDSEVRHAEEDVGYLLFEGPSLLYA